MEYRETTIARLQQKLGREPTEAEIKETRDALWRRQLEAMMWTDLMFRDEADRQ